MTEKENSTPDETVEAQVEAHAEAQTDSETVEIQPEVVAAEGEELALALQDAQAKADEYWNQLLRLQAEMDNTRRRAERDVANAHKYALEKFVNELLPVKDSLEMGEAAAKAEGADLAKVSEGLELTLKVFASAVSKFGVTEVNPVGEKFNPDQHQAMSMQDVPDAAPNTVVTVYQKGYLLNDRLIRPAMVVVASANSGSALGQGDVSGGDTKIDEMA